MEQTRFWTWSPWRLRSELAQRGQRIADLSVATGITRARLYKYAALRNGRVPDAETAALIAEVLGVEPRDLYQVLEGAA